MARATRNTQQEAPVAADNVEVEAPVEALAIPQGWTPIASAEALGKYHNWTEENEVYRHDTGFLLVFTRIGFKWVIILLNQQMQVVPLLHEQPIAQQVAQAAPGLYTNAAEPPFNAALSRAMQLGWTQS